MNWLTGQPVTGHSTSAKVRRRTLDAMLQTPPPPSALPRQRAIGRGGTAARIVTGVVFVLLGGLGGGGFDWTALVVGLAAMPALATLAQLVRLSVSKTALHATGGLAFCLNLVIGAVLLATPWTSHPTCVFLGASMLLAAWRGYAGCETLAISNWLLHRDDQVGCVLFTPLDRLEAQRLG